MSMSGPGGAGGRDQGAQRWGNEHDHIEEYAQQQHLAHEAARIHAEEAAEAAEEGRALPTKRPWWKFWG